MKLPDKKYNIIYADPAWSYKDKLNHHGGSAESHYNTMTIQEIYDLPIKNITADNCFLFLWVTFPNLIDCLEVFKHWGFTYKTVGFIWVKTNKQNNDPFFGIGHYTKSNAELCLLGIKGKPQVISNSVSSVVQSHRQEHSVKPPVIRERIVELVGDLPRIELFARQQMQGWDVWGNQELQKQF
tara:strand:- start:94 stop:642 length:549 start_codon:yes stop_codon:yes gene_type:complete